MERIIITTIKKLLEVSIPMEISLAKVDTGTVTIDEIKIGANKLATFFCNDESFQTSGGSSVEACTDKYLSFKSMCEDRIFGKEKTTFTNKNEVSALSKRFVACVGIS
ncbi:hypothetical protein ACOBV8_00560 [Pseudoalteromonas espejiana]